MKLWKLAAWLCVTAYAFGQGTRYDSNIFTSANSAPPGSQTVMYTVPFASITVCGATAVGNPCTNTVAIYSNSGLTVSAKNPLTADVHGRFGFWIAAGSYSYSVMTTGGTNLGTFFFQTGAGGGGGTTISLQHNGSVLANQNVLNFNDTTPAAPSGANNVIFQSDASGKLSGYVPAGSSALSLTTIGSTGAATYSSGTLNIPNYTYTLTVPKITALGALTNDTTGSAAAVDQVTVTGVPATGQAIVATSPSTASWQAVSGSGGFTGQVAGYAIKAASPTTATAPFPIDDSVTTTNTITAHKALSVNDGSGAGGSFSATEGTAPTATSGLDILYADSTAHCLKVSSNGGAFGCITGGMVYPAAGIAVSTGSAWGSSVSVLPVASGGTGTTTPGIVAGTNVTVSGTWPNQTVNSSGGGTSAPLTGAPLTSALSLQNALSNAATTPVHVIVHGDSFNISDHTNGGGNGGGPVISTNRYPEQARIYLQEVHGSHGTGVFPLVLAASSSPALNSEAWSCTGTVDTSTGSLGPTQSGGNTLVHMSSGAVCTFNDSRSIPFTNVSTYYATPTSSSSLAIASGATSLGAATSSGTAAGVSNGGLTARRYDSSTALTLGTHSISFTCTGDCYLYAAEGVNGSTGVSVDNLAVGGATAAMFGSATTNQLAFDALIPGGVQAAIGMDQTNDVAGNVVVSTFSTNLQNWITATKALPGSPSVILIPPPVDIVTGTYSPTLYTAAQQALCAGNAILCVDLTQAFGATYNAAYFDQTGTAWPGGNGGVHPNDATQRTMGQYVLGKILNAQSAPSGGGCSVNCTITGTGSSSALTLSSASALPLVISSTNAGGASFQLSGTASGVHNWGFQSDAFGHFLAGDFTSGSYGLEMQIAGGGAGYMAVNNNTAIGWRPNGVTTDTTGPDTAFTRTAAGAVALGNGTAGDTSGSLKTSILLPGVTSAASLATDSNGKIIAGSGGGGTATTVASAEVVTFSATPTFSTSTNTSRIVLTANVTSFTLGAGADGQMKTLCFKQGAGPYTVTAPSNVHGFFIIGTTSGSWNCQSYTYDLTDSIWLATTTGVINE